MANLLAAVVASAATTQLDDPVHRGLVAAAMALWCAINLLRGVPRQWASRPLPPRYLAAACASTAVGLFAAGFEQAANGASGGWSDVAFGVAYVTCIMASREIHRSRERRARRVDDRALDAMVIALGASLTMWTAVIDPLLGTDVPGGRLGPVLMVLGDLAIVWVIARILLGRRDRFPALWGMVAALGAFVVGDIVKAVAMAGGHATTLAEAAFVLGLGIGATACVHPSAGRLMDASGAAAVGGLGRLQAVGTAAIVAPIVPFLLGRQPDARAVGLIAGAMVLTLLWRVRQLILDRDHELARRMTMQAALEEQATHDELTGLPNRAALRAHLEERMRTSDRLAVVFADLDGFKLVNDSLGHPLGDRLLVAIGERLRGLTGPDQMIARFGGDEFVLVVEGVDHAGAAAAGRALVRHVSGEYVIDGHVLEVGASAGVALMAGPTTADELIRDADAAMYRAKSQGRGEIAVFDHGLRRELLASLAMERDVRTALVEGGLTLAYQPAVDLVTGATTSFEALARWPAGPAGVGPATFVPLLEELGLARQLGRWALTEATSWAVAADAAVSVNISPRHLVHPSVPADVADCLERSGLPGDRLVLELTERSVLTDEDVAARHMAAVRTLGVRIAVDDFGTGFFSLSQLRTLPVDIVKIDRSFVMGARTSARDAAVVQAVALLAHGLDLEIVAEGVEDATTAAFVRDLGCHVGQGYLWSPPQTPDQAARWGLQDVRAV